MELKEEKQLKEVSAAFAGAVSAFRLKKNAEALKAFSEIVEKYADSEYYGVLEVQARAKVYQAIIDARLNPRQLPLESDEDYLQQGIYLLNSGDYAGGRDVFLGLQKKGQADPYLDYLLALCSRGLADRAALLASLGRACAADGFYKVLAFNEPDFFELREDQEFLALVE